MKDNLMLWWALWGKRIGATLILGPFIYDILLMGLRNWEKIKVCNWGFVSVGLGVIAWWLANYCDRELM